MLHKAAAWGVHLYTALGGLIGVLALFAVHEGDIRGAFGLLVITMLIDATDGMLARRIKVREVLPKFDGAALDNAIDLLTYGYIPIFIIGSQGLVPHIAWTLIPAFALLYAYGQIDMKTPDSFFLGFPSYWNVVALYLWWLQPSDGVAIMLLIVPAILTFVPTRYLYPSRNQVMWQLSWSLGAIWFIVVMVLLAQSEPNQDLIRLSLFYPVYYTVASFYVDYLARRGTLPPEPREEHRARRFTLKTRPFRFRFRLRR